MRIAVFCASSLPHDANIYKSAQHLGALLAQGGHCFVYGGSNLGLMGAVSGSAFSNGGEVCAVIPTFFSEEIISSQPVSQLVRVASMAQRKEYIIQNSDAFIALPGGIGTLDEILEVLVHNQLGPLRNPNYQDKPIGLYNPDGFWGPFMQQVELMGLNGFYRSGKAPNFFAESDITVLLSKLVGDDRLSTKPINS